MDLDLYLNLMTEVKRRTNAINDILKKAKTTSYQATNIEFMCLQLRKMLELISLGSLVANKKEFEEQQIKFQKFWHAKRIISDIERLNPDFYPKPIKEVPTSNPAIKNDLVELKTGFLTKEEFIKVYEKCGKIMHADNPFGSKTDLDYYEKQIKEWLFKTINLLNCHMIKLKGNEDFYLIHMQEKGDDLVHGYRFGRVN
jgi:hypothetical protein